MNASIGLIEVENGMDAANKVMIFETLMDCSSLFLTGNTDTASWRNSGAHVRMGVSIHGMYLRYLVSYITYTPAQLL